MRLTLDWDGINIGTIKQQFANVPRSQLKKMLKQHWELMEQHLIVPLHVWLYTHGYCPNVYAAQHGLNSRAERVGEDDANKKQLEERS